ncbi:hypothetical protein ACWCO0_30835 [Streptomyces tubercidicus]
MGPQMGLASGLVNTSQQFGSVLGLSLLSGVAAARTEVAAGSRDVALTEGFSAAFLTGAALALVAALLTLRLAVPAAPAPAEGPGDADPNRSTDQDPAVP